MVLMCQIHALAWSGLVPAAALWDVPALNHAGRARRESGSETPEFLILKTRITPVVLPHGQGGETPTTGPGLGASQVPPGSAPTAGLPAAGVGFELGGTHSSRDGASSPACAAAETSCLSLSAHSSAQLWQIHCYDRC